MPVLFIHSHYGPPPAAYLSAQEGRRVDLTDPATQEQLAAFVPDVALGKWRAGV